MLLYIQVLSWHDWPTDINLPDAHVNIGKPKAMTAFPPTGADKDIRPQCIRRATLRIISDRRANDEVSLSSLPHSALSQLINVPHKTLSLTSM